MAPVGGKEGLEEGRACPGTVPGPPDRRASRKECRGAAPPEAALTGQGRRMRLSSIRRRSNKFPPFWFNRRPSDRKWGRIDFTRRSRARRHRRVRPAAGRESARSATGSRPSPPPSCAAWTAEGSQSSLYPFVGEAGKVPVEPFVGLADELAVEAPPATRRTASLFVLA